MNEMNINPELDMKTMFAIFTNPDGAAMIGAWNGMKMLAASDPEGCVRMTPAMPMDTKMLSGLFHCTESIVEKTIALFEKMNWLTIKDGLIKILDCTTCSPAENEAIEEAKARKREANRIRQAERRARQRQAKLAAENAGAVNRNEAGAAAPVKNAAAVCDSHPVTNRVACDMRDKQCDTHCDTPAQSRMDAGSANCATGRGSGVTGCDTPAQSRMNAGSANCATGRDSSVTGCDTGNMINTNTINALKADKHISLYQPQNAESKIRAAGLPENGTQTCHASQPEPAFNPSGRCLPFLPGKQQGKIPLHRLPDTVRNVIGEWNRLPLPKYNGLIPSLLEKLKHLLQRYGEQVIRKTIAGIANSAFLLGKKENSSWSASLAWLLDPDNFAKVLTGKYQDKTGGSCYDGCLAGERFPFYLPGVQEGNAPMTPEQIDSALDNMLHPRNALLEESARLLGISC